MNFLFSFIPKRINNGTIVEQGTHDGLVRQKGMYYSLIQNQLDLETV